MTMNTDPEARPHEWRRVCLLADLVPDLGVAALVDGDQVALFRVAGGAVYAVQQADPHADGANVMSRGIVGSHDGLDTVASPLHKELYALGSGETLGPGGNEVRLRTWPVRVRQGVVEVLAGR